MSRRHRVIQLEKPPAPLAVEPDWVDDRKVVHTVNQDGDKVVKRLHRMGDRLKIQTEVQYTTETDYGVQHRTRVETVECSAIIPFRDIWNACEVVYDEYNTLCPWEDCDGYEHSNIAVITLDLDQSQDQQIRRHAKGSYISSYDRATRLIHVDVTGWTQSLFDALSDGGASKQVAAELVAIKTRRTLKRLVEWAKGGWYWHIVEADFMGYHADAAGGFPAEDEAESIGVPLVADDIATQMHDDGFTIVGWDPKTIVMRFSSPTDAPADSAAAAYRKHKLKLNTQNWSDD